MPDDRSIDEIIKSYPGCKEEILSLCDKLVELSDAIKSMREKYPVDGYTWDIDINLIPSIEAYKNEKSLENSPVTLTSRDYLKTTSQYAKCLVGSHKFTLLAPHIKWCTCCGTIKETKIAGDQYNEGTSKIIDIVRNPSVFGDGN